MEDNDKFRKPHYPRRNGPVRPPPGVQKAMQNFGVKDLREILDKKQHGKFEDDKKPEPRENRPPPDPPYNYLKDPTRDSSVQPEDKHQLPKRGNQRSRHEDSSRKGQPRNRDQPTISERHSSAPHANDERGRASKKELRFMDPVDDKSQDMRGEKYHDLRGEKPQDVQGEKANVRGRSYRRGHNARHTEPREERIENLVNIKVELSTETGRRNCVLDESTKIPDLKYVPDHPRKPRGRGPYRGRGRGRGSFRGRKEMPNRSSSEETKQSEAESPANTSAHSPEINAGENAENDEPEEFVDSNENYDDSGYVEANISHQAENEEPNTAFDASSVEAITITSQQFQDGDVQRAVEVTAAKESETIENREQVLAN